MISGLDVDGSNVVGQKNKLVCMQLCAVFVRELLFRDKARLKQPGYKCASAGLHVTLASGDIGLPQQLYRLCAYKGCHHVSSISSDIVY